MVIKDLDYVEDNSNSERVAGGIVAESTVVLVSVKQLALTKGIAFSYGGDASVLAIADNKSTINFL